MDIRSKLQDEYFKLTKTLNSTNRKKNQKTEVSFFIRTNAESNRFLGCTANNEFFLRIANQNPNSLWQLEQAFPFQQLAEYILKNNDLDAEDIDLTIKNSLRRLFAVEQPN